MEHTNLIHAALLGLLEGLTEFIPVSSTGHLILLTEILGFQGPPGKLFEIFIQLGAILAICVVYYKRIITLVTHFYHPATLRFIGNLLIAFLPAAVMGLLFHSLITTYLFTVKVVLINLILGGFIIILIEKFGPRTSIQEVDTITKRTAFKIGCFQMLALMPGVSRSGATIIGGMLCGLSRNAAAEFSFFLALPTMIAASLYSLYKQWDILDTAQWNVLFIGFLFAFIAAVAVVKLVLRYINTYGFSLFGWYRILLGGIGLLLL